MCHSPSLGLCGIAEKTEFIGGVADHVHLLLSMPTTMAMAKAIPLIKRGSSAWNHQITSGTSEHINRPSGTGPLFSCFQALRARLLSFSPSGTGYALSL
ncbi:MAG: transposase [Verrucomicrobia bacterium]|nr:transposase [Verrucomicrobiota bacterium]